MMLTFSAVRAQYLPELSFLRFQWHPKWSGLRSFRESLTAVAQLVEQGTVAAALIDMNELPSLGLEEQFWLATHWMPRVSVPAVRHVALVLPATNMYNQMAAESLLRAGRHFAYYEVQFFADAPSALDWLLGHRPEALAPLEAEWRSATAPRPELAGQSGPSL